MDRFNDKVLRNFLRAAAIAFALSAEAVAAPVGATAPQATPGTAHRWAGADAHRPGERPAAPATRKDRQRD